MIFLAGSLDMNGGSTFLLRIAQQVSPAEKLDIVILSSVIDPQLRSQLEKYANVIELKQLVDDKFTWCGTSQAAIFLPFDRLKIERLLQANNRAVHAMGIFGLVYAYRLARSFGQLKITAGVYQQYEFLHSSAFFFVRQANKMFSNLPAENIIFFNEYNREKYAQVFKKNYAQSVIAPIGVPLPFMHSGVERKFDYGRLVSVGNLVDFKTYNEHVIRTIAPLVTEFPQLRYDVYGDGDQVDYLQSLIAQLNVGDAVTLHGRIPYSEFRNVVGSAMGFIGSGTALLEAAALQVPAITGIESIKTPETYGFLSGVKGYTYNELVPGAELVPLRTVILTLLNADSAEMQQTGARCADKAAEFSIEKTVQGLNKLKLHSKLISVKFSLAFRVIFFLSFVTVAVLDLLNINRKFRMRRDQA